MVEVRDITAEENPPDNADWVLITRAGDVYSAIGSVAGRTDATFYTPQAFGSLEEALHAAKSWAANNNVPVVYVRGI